MGDPQGAQWLTQGAVRVMPLAASAPVLQMPTRLKDKDDVAVPADQLQFMHRTRTPVLAKEYEQHHTVHGEDLLQPLNCTRGNSCDDRYPCNDVCRSDCCIDKGILVVFIAKDTRKLYDTHLHLYYMALRVFAVECIVQNATATHAPISYADATEQYLRNYTSNNRPDVPRVLEYLDANNHRLLDCAMRDMPPEGMRVYVDSQHPPGPHRKPQHLHGLLQPLHGSNFTTGAYSDIAMARGNGWYDCPYFIRAAANPDDISSFTLPPPSPGVVATIVSALETLLSYRLECMAKRRDATANGGDVLLLSTYIVALCQEPSTVIDLDACQTFPLVDPVLARFLLEAIKATYINSIKATYTPIVEIIAYSLGMDAMEVYHASPDVPPPAADNLTRTIVLYGNVVPSVIDRKEGYLLLKNEGTGSSHGRQLPLHMTLSSRLFRTSKLPATTVKVTLHSLGDLLAEQSRESVRAFIGNACTSVENSEQLKNLIGAVHKPSNSPGDLSLQEAANVFRDQGTASACASAGSVVVVFRGDGATTKNLAEVQHLLDSNHLIADFVVVYLSYLLRLKMAEAGVDSHDYSLPLATRALMVFPVPREDVEGEMSEWAGPVLPPLPHHPVFFTVLSPNREDIGYTLGHALALQIKEGIHIARAAAGLRTSFMVLFIDNRHSFNLSLAIQREHGFNEGAANVWTKNVLVCGKNHLAKCDLDAVDSVTIRTNHHSVKRFLIITWHDRLRHLAAKLAVSMLNKSAAANASFVVANLKMARLDTPFPHASAEREHTDRDGSVRD